jgi:predicted kinase
MSDNPKLYIMCGLPFSGKSYTGKKIAELIDGEFLSYDELWVELDSSGDKNPSYERLSELAQTRIRESLKNGRSIVYDTLNDTFGNRELLRKIAKEVGCEAITIYMNTSKEVINQRRQENEKTKERHSVTDETVEEYSAKFEAPIGEEKVIEIKPGDDINEKLKS